MLVIQGRRKSFLCFIQVFCEVMRSAPQQEGDAREAEVYAAQFAAACAAHFSCSNSEHDEGESAALLSAIQIRWQNEKMDAMFPGPWQCNDVVTINCIAI
jgi:hypothetical protein